MTKPAIVAHAKQRIHCHKVQCSNGLIIRFGCGTPLSGNGLGDVADDSFGVLHVQAAIDDDVLAGDERRPVAAEKLHGVDDVVRQPQPADGNGALQEPDEFLVLQGVLARFLLKKEAGCDGVDADAAVTEGYRVVADNLPDAGLRHVIAKTGILRRDQPRRDRAYDDDGTVPEVELSDEHVDQVLHRGQTGVDFALPLVAFAAKSLKQHERGDRSPLGNVAEGGPGGVGVDNVDRPGADGPGWYGLRRRPSGKYRDVVSGVGKSARGDAAGTPRASHDQRMRFPLHHESAPIADSACHRGARFRRNSPTESVSLSIGDQAGYSPSSLSGGAAFDVMRDQDIRMHEHEMKGSRRQPDVEIAPRSVAPDRDRFRRRCRDRQRKQRPRFLPGRESIDRAPSLCGLTYLCRLRSWIASRSRLSGSGVQRQPNPVDIGSIASPP